MNYIPLVTILQSIKNRRMENLTHGEMKKNVYISIPYYSQYTLELLFINKNFRDYYTPRYMSVEVHREWKSMWRLAFPSYELQFECGFRISTHFYQNFLKCIHVFQFKKLFDVLTHKSGFRMSILWINAATAIGVYVCAPVYKLFNIEHMCCITLLHKKR